MGNPKSKRAQMRVIETIIASFIVISALSFVSIFAMSPSSSEHEIADLDKMGYSALHDLDQQGLLDEFVYMENWADLRAVLKMTLPVDVYFNLTIYEFQGDQITKSETPPIIYGDPTTFEASKNLASVTYSLVGYQQRDGQWNYVAEYEPRILILQLTRG